MYALNVVLVDRQENNDVDLIKVVDPGNSGGKRFVELVLVSM